MSDSVRPHREGYKIRKGLDERHSTVRVGRNAVVDRVKKDIAGGQGESCWNQRQMLGLVLKCNTQTKRENRVFGCRYRQVR